MTNLHNVLVQYNEVVSQDIQQELILNEANQILSESFKSDLKYLEKAGLSGNLHEAEIIRKDNAIASKFDEVYDIESIRKLAINYRLRFLPSELYSGTIDSKLPKIIKDFCNKTDVIPEPCDFYILAPASSFKLQQRPKDPLMFYKINDNKYAFIHKWGNDLSSFRYVNSLLKRDGEWIAFLAIVLAIFSIACLFIGMKADISHVLDTNYYNIYWHALAYSVPSALILGVFAGNYQFSYEIWDSEFDN